MSWALVQSNSAGSGSASPAVAFTTANLSAGTTEICYATSYAGTTTGVSDGTNAFIKIAAISNGGGEVSCWALNTPAGKVGTKPTITATQSGNTGSSGILIQEISGLAVGATLALLADGTPGTGTYSSGTTAGPPSYTDGGHRRVPGLRARRPGVRHHLHSPDRLRLHRRHEKPERVRQRRHNRLLQVVHRRHGDRQLRLLRRGRVRPDPGRVQTARRGRDGLR